MIQYTNSLENITTEMLGDGFFAGWPNPPSKDAHMRILNGSYCVWIAIDTDRNKIVGFINAISDGFMSAYIPLLEVLPDYQTRGIGRELVTRTLESLKHLYIIDLTCDEPLQSYYKKLGMSESTVMFMRNYERQSCE